MSRHLPEYRNLEYLKKQAKDLLKEFKQQNPATKLSYAQFALAREYGFASWPKLIAHVASLSPPITPSEVPAAAPTQSDAGEVAEVSPFVGEWTANLSKSRKLQFQSLTLQFEVAGDSLTITDKGVDEFGFERHNKGTMQVDGKEHEQADGHTLIHTWCGSHTFEQILKHKDGRILREGMWEVSPDGMTLTLTASRDDDLVDLVIVFDKKTTNAVI